MNDLDVTQGVTFSRSPSWGSSWDVQPALQLALRPDSMMTDPGC